MNVKGFCSIVSNWHSNEWLVLLTALALVFTGFQFLLAKKSYETGTRAYVGLENAHLWKTKQIEGGYELVEEQGLQLTRYPIVDLRFVNKGATPANDFKGESHLVIVNSDEITETTDLPVLPKTMEKSSVSVIPKDAQHNTRATFLAPAPMSEEAFQDIRSGKKFLVVHGIVEYKDIFQKSHKTSFCRIYVPRADLFGACSAKNWIN